MNSFKMTYTLIDSTSEYTYEAETEAEIGAYRAEIESDLETYLVEELDELGEVVAAYDGTGAGYAS